MLLAADAIFSHRKKAYLAKVRLFSCWLHGGKPDQNIGLPLRLVSVEGSRQLWVEGGR
jgi:hypothetical protein